MKWIPAVVALFSLAGVAALEAAPPNFVIVLADDCTYRDLGTYGGQAKTPNLDRLAGEGMKFTRCFQTVPMCSPTRQNLYTGLYPAKSGAMPNHTMSHDWVRSIASYLTDHGYRAFLSGKQHISPNSVFSFEYSGIDNNPDPEAIDRALAGCAENETPFVLIAASNEPHGPWDKGDPSAYPPESIELPPVLVDAPNMREVFSRYLAEITYFDSQVGEVLALLEKHGHSENTIVMVLSEQGNSFPFAKWTLYDAGVQSGCVVRWPGRVEPGSVSDAMVEYVDVVPTFLDAAGIPAPEILDGRSFLPVLMGETDRHKDVVFGMQTSRGIISGPEHYGIRSARNERYLYIRNLTPEVTFQSPASNHPTFRTWERLAAEGDEHAQERVNAYPHRPAEELYDVVADPWNLTNLIADPELTSVRDDLRGRLDAWMESQGDLGQATEMTAFERMPRGTPTGRRTRNNQNEGDDL